MRTRKGRGGARGGRGADLFCAAASGGGRCAGAGVYWFPTPATAWLRPRVQLPPAPLGGHTHRRDAGRAAGRRAGGGAAGRGGADRVPLLLLARRKALTHAEPPKPIHFAVLPTREAVGQFRGRSAAHPHCSPPRDVVAPLSFQPTPGSPLELWTPQYPRPRTGAGRSADVREQPRNRHPHPGDPGIARRRLRA